MRARPWRAASFARTKCAGCGAGSEERRRRRRGQEKGAFPRIAAGTSDEALPKRDKIA